MWALNNFEVGFMIHVPNLIHQRFIRIDEFGDFLFKTSDNNAVGHFQTKGMMTVHLISDVLTLVVEDKACSSGMMCSKSSGIKDMIVIDKENFVMLCSIVLNLFVVFELMKLFC